MIELIIILAICGVVLWFVNQYVPMAPAVKTAINIIVVIALVLFVLNFFGITRWRLDRRPQLHSDLSSKRIDVEQAGYAPASP